jgi:DNA-binding NarL/FixJ family response regulator
MSTSLLVADFRDLILAGLQRYVARTKIEIVDQVAAGKNLGRSIRQQKPDVVVIGRLLDEDRLTALERVRKYRVHLPVLMLGINDEAILTSRPMALGANGCLSEACPRNEFLAAVRAVVANGHVWSEEQLQRGKHGRPKATEKQIQLTPRELDVLRHLAAGLPNREIAQLLGIRFDTVKDHVTTIRSKLKVSSRKQAALWAIQNGLI